MLPVDAPTRGARRSVRSEGQEKRPADVSAEVFFYQTAVKLDDVLERPAENHFGVLP